jgi:hypothetical protein
VICSMNYTQQNPKVDHLGVAPLGVRATYSMVGSIEDTNKSWSVSKGWFDKCTTHRGKGSVHKRGIFLA